MTADSFTKMLARLRGWTLGRNANPLPFIFTDSAPVDLRIVGRMLFHAALVGISAGFVGAAFFGMLELVQRILLEDLAGYVVLRAHGETFAQPESVSVFRPWLLLFLPALGGLGCGLLTQLAPETRGGGGDAMIEAYHNQAGIIRRRVLWVKSLASICTLGTGGAGGREGPTMQIGAALGSFIARALKVNPRERRILLIAGVAAGISAVFRTPLGAALLAVEVLYRDGFESDALVPSIFASVVAYSVVISIFGESTLFAHAPRFVFVPWHLCFYALLAVLLAALAAGFVASLRRFSAAFDALPVPPWVKPTLGGLALGVLCTPVLVLVGSTVGTKGQGLGILGGGYGAIQAAISGASWLPEGWRAVQLLLLMSLIKLVAASLTIGSGGSAGDFAPSLAIGGLFGGAFGRAVQLLVDDPRIDPGAFTLVGMGVFYGGIAHVPLSALVLVCELAGNYDLLVPLMLAQGIAFVALRKRSLYSAQPTQRAAASQLDVRLRAALRAVRVSDVMIHARPFITFQPDTAISHMRAQLSEATWQDVFPVLDQDKLVGLVSADAMKMLVSEQPEPGWARASDLMQAPVYVRPSDDMQSAMSLLLDQGLREVPVIEQGAVVGFLDERDVARIYVELQRQSDSTSTPWSTTGTSWKS